MPHSTFAAKSQEAGPWLEIDPLKRLQLALNSGCMTNVTFKVKNKEFRCHSQIIGLASPKFAEMVKNNEFQLPDMDPNHFKFILDIIYSVKPSTALAVDQLLETARISLELQVQVAVEFCVKKLSELVDVKNACRILDFASLVKNQDLEDQCMMIIKKDPSEVLCSADILQCKHATLENIVQQDELNEVNELKLFQTCDLWAKKHTELGNRREALGSIIQCIRFLAMSADDFSDQVCSNGILTSVEERDIMRCIATGKHHMMPKDFSKEICRKVFQIKTEKIILPIEIQDRLKIKRLLSSGLRFSVNKVSYLVGVEILPERKKGLNTTGTMSLIDKNEAVEVSFNDSKSLFEVNFDRPCKLSANEAYTLNVEFKEPRSRDYAVLNKGDRKFSKSSSLEITILEGVLFPVQAVLIAEKIK